MIKAIDVYSNAKDQLNEEENGQFSYSYFNRVSWRAQLRLMDWLSGDVAAVQPPEPFLTSKNKDWLAPFIVSVKKAPTDGVWPLPEGYYRALNYSVVETYNTQDCETGKVERVIKPNTPGEIVDGFEFNTRANSFIDELAQIPIAKIVNNKLVVGGSVGSFEFEYLRYPARAEIRTRIDAEYNNEVVDSTTDFEWPPYAEDLLVWFIVDLFHNRVSHQAGKQMNMATQKTVRG